MPSDVAIRLGADYSDSGVRDFIADMGASQIQTIALQEAMTNLTLAAGAVAFGIPLAARAVQLVFDAARATSPEIGILDNEFEKLAKRDDTIQALAKVTGMTEADADAALRAAKNNSEFAESLKRVADNANLLARDKSILENPFSDLRSRQGAQQEISRVGDLASDKEQIQLQLRAQMYGEVVQEATKSYDEIARLSEQRANEETNLNDKLKDFAKSEADAFTQAARSRASAERNAADETLRMARELTDSLARISQQQNDRLDVIRREYGDKESDLAYQQQKQAEQFREERIQQERQSSDRFLQIRLQEARSLEQLDFNTHEDLLHAKTNAEKEDIMRRYQFEHGQITQKANDQRTEAEKQRDEERQLFAERRALADQDFAHQHEINVRETGEKVADARKAANEQVAAARLRNQEETSDLKTRLQEQKNDIQARYAAEIAAVETAKAAFLAAEDAKIAKLNTELSILKQVVAFQLANIPIGDSYNPFGYEQQRMGEKGGSAGGAYGTGSSGHGYDTGGVVPGPMGAPRMILAHGGETVSRAGESAVKESSPQMVFINANGSLAPIINDVVEQLMRGNVFRENVKLIFHTEAAG